MSIFYNWRDAVQYLKELITRTTPLAGNGIAVEQTVAGRRISLCGQAASSASARYAGQFTLKVSVEDGENYLEVVNGEFEESFWQSQPAGRINIGGSWLDVASYIDTPEGSGYAYLLVTYEYVNGAVLPTYKAEIKTGTTLPNNYDGTAKIYRYVVLLGSYTTITSDDTEIMTATQVWTGGTVYVTGVVQ